MKKASILIFQNKNKEILLLKTVKEDKWSLPGGKSEGDETYVETLVREVREETGYQIDDTYKCVLFRDDATYGNGQEFHSFVFLLDVEKMFIPKLSNEHSQYVWITPEEAMRTLELRGNFTYSVMVQLITGRQMFWPLYGDIPEIGIQNKNEIWKEDIFGNVLLECKPGTEILSVSAGISDLSYNFDKGIRVLTEDGTRSIIYYGIERYVKPGQKILSGQKLGRTLDDHLVFYSSERLDEGKIKCDSVEYLKKTCL